MTKEIPTTGPEAILHALKTLDLKELEDEQRQVIQSKVKTKRGRAVRLLGIIEGLRKNEVSPDQLMINSVPVIPPKFRPFSITGDTFLPGDSNEVYRDVTEYRRLYENTEKSLGREGASEVYMDLAKAVKAAYGYGESPNPKTKARGVKGFFQMVTGASPKTSFMQQKMLSKPMDTVGRGVVIPDADLGMDEVGVPEEMAWRLYGNYVQRGLVRGGMSPAGALDHITRRSPQALKALESELPNRPAVLTRSPAWHRTNVIGQKVRLVPGDAIRVNTFVTDGLNMDFDGDDHCNSTTYAFSRDVFNDLQSRNLLDSAAILPPNSSMFQKLHIPFIDPETHVVCVLDLEDIPHGDLLLDKERPHGNVRMYAALPGSKVIAYDEESDRLVWAEVTGWSEHKGCKTEIVQLENRRQIYTDDDPRAVYGVLPGEISKLRRFTPTEALAAKAIVPCARNTRELMATLDPMQSVRVALEKECPFMELALDYDFGWFLGALCGDGWWDKKDYEFYAQRGRAGLRNINFADLKELNSARLEKFIRKNLDPDATLNYYRHETLKADHPDRYGDTIKHSYNFKHSELLAEFLDKHLGGQGDDDTSGSGNKRVPGFLFQAPESFRKGFLCGLVDTDGSVSVSNAKGKPQLMCALTSTSLRLLRETQALCATLGITSTVSWSKKTSGGNKSWILSMSAWDCKQKNVFVDLACDWKRDLFVKTEVSGGKGSLAFDKVLFPKEVATRIMKDIPSPKIHARERETPVADRSPELLGRMEQQSLYQIVRTAAKEGVIPRATALRIHCQSVADYLHGARRIEEAQDMLKAATDGIPEFTQAMSDQLRVAIRDISPKQDDNPQLYKLGCKTAARLNRPLKDGKMSARVVAGLLEFLTMTTPYAPAHLDTQVQDWYSRVVKNYFVSWSPVVAVEYTDQVEPGYDLTVPGYETFMSADGIILSNTGLLHIPSTREAVKDVNDKMMASKMLWSIKNRSDTMANPKHEQVIGLSMGANTGGKRQKFATNEEAMSAIESGQIDLNDDIEITPNNDLPYEEPKNIP